VLDSGYLAKWVGHLEGLLQGIFSGLASTGQYQMFTLLLKRNSCDSQPLTKKYFEQDKLIKLQNY